MRRTLSQDSLKALCGLGLLVLLATNGRAWEWPTTQPPPAASTDESDKPRKSPPLTLVSALPDTAPPRLTADEPRKTSAATPIGSTAEFWDIPRFFGDLVQGTRPVSVSIRPCWRNRQSDPHFMTELRRHGPPSA